MSQPHARVAAAGAMRYAHQRNPSISWGDLADIAFEHAPDTGYREVVEAMLAELCKVCTNCPPEVTRAIEAAEVALRIDKPALPRLQDTKETE